MAETAPRARGRDGLGIGIIGCGDVAFRHYIPALEYLGGHVQVVGCCDLQPELAERAAARCRSWSPRVQAVTDYEGLLTDARVDAVLNLTPIPVHASVSEAALSAGLHTYSEKPLAGTVEEVDRLIGLARERDRLLLCAPAVAVTPRFRWLAELVSSGRLGSPTLAVGSAANMGVAGWREYTGSPEGHYALGGGPLLDIGVYLLHAMVSLLGPVGRVQAMGGISIPERVVRAGPFAGERVAVTAPDHTLVQLDFGGNRFGQLVASYAVPASQAPWLELHLTGGTVTIGAETQYDADGPVDIFVDDPGPLGLEGWIRGARRPFAGPSRDAISFGAAHFVACLRGEEEPVLTAERARHILEVSLKAMSSMRDGRAHTVTRIASEAG